MMSSIKRFISEEDGMEFVEYGLLVTVFVMGAFTAWETLATKFGPALEKVGKEIAPKQ